ncbi:MAG: hypothetical protein LBU62_12030, partial [Bacteroidales bacterium]|nr:hypothetical protein [Bacteroidales bacterium]
MNNNIHQANIPAEVLEAALAKANEIRDILSPYSIVLTTDQRHTLLKMGEKSLPFVEKAHELARLNPALLPAFVNMDDFTTDFTDAHGIMPLKVTMQQVLQTIDDTQMLAGSEA